MSKNKTKLKFRLDRILLIPLFLVLSFSIFNIGRVLASVDKITIKDVSILDKSATVDASIVSFDKDSVLTDVTFHKLDDYVLFNFKLINNDSKTYTIKTISDNNTYTYLNYEYDKHENEEVKPNQEIDLEVRVTYKNSVTDMNNRVKDNSLDFNITFVDEDGEEDEVVIPINPKTGDNLHIYIIIGVISLVGLIVVSKYKKINKSLLVLLLLLTPFVVNAASLNFQIDINNTVKLFDKMLLTIDVDGEKQEVIVPYDTSIEKPTPEVRPGYNFIGYFIGDEEYDFTKNVTEDTEIEARYELINYDITYDLAGGSVSTQNPTKYTVEDEITLNNPTKTGYVFAGWTGSNGTGLQTRVTINKGTTGNLNYVAHFQEGQDTAYLVIHKYQKLTQDGYDTEEESLKGVTGSKVTPAIKHKDGFKDPATKELTILADGSASIDYIYDRVEYTFSVGENVTSSLANGSYPYETQITVTADTVQGYTFSKWEDNSTANPRTITLKGNTSVQATYTPNENTPYKVIHKYQKVTQDGYEIEEEKLKGVTGTNVTPAIRHKEGFQDPQTQQLTILANGSASVEYTYDRIEYTFSIGDNITSTKVAGNYPYGTEITVTANDVQGYTFSKWEDNSTTNPRTITITGNTTIEATYTPNNNTAYLVKHRYQKVTQDGYDIEEQPLTGTTGATITPAIRHRDGFQDPETQQLTILADGSASIEYTYNRIEYAYSFGNNITSTKTAGNYPYGTAITVTANDVQGYTFSKWEDNSTTNPRTITISGDIAVAATYTPNNNTAYLVVHKYQKVTQDGYDTEEQPLTGTTGDTVTPAIRHRDGFQDPTTQQLTILADGSARIEYTYNRIEYTYSFGENVTSTKTAGTYPYETEITVTAGTVQGYTFSKWEDNSTTNPRTITLTGNTNVVASYTINSYTITFETNGGTPVSQIVKNYNQPIGTIETTTKDDYNFAGWFDENGTTQIDENTLVTENKTYYAHWEEITTNFICQKTTTLSSERCESGTENNVGCRSAGYEVDDQIIYGQIPTSSTITTGDTYFCDVDGTGYNNRFYVLSADSETALLIMNHSLHEGSVRSEAPSYMPTLEEWTNLTIAPRFPTQADIELAAGHGATSAGSLDNINFVFEATSYAHADTTTYRSTVWVKNDNGVLDRRIHKNNRAIQVIDSTKIETSVNSVRPVIEVPISRMDDSYIITFNANGGTVTNEKVIVAVNSPIGTLETPTFNDYAFDGWYTDQTYTTKISSSTIPTGFVTYYAKWLVNVEDAEYVKDNYAITVGETAEILINDINTVEARTYLSGDSSIATVDESGVITGVADGETTITITGTISGTIKVINVRVTANLEKFTVTLDSRGGTEYDPIEVVRDGEIGSLPTPTYNGFTFDGWYDDLQFTNRVTSDTLVTDDMIIYARWIPDNAVAEINNKFYTTIQAATGDNTIPSGSTIKILQDVTLTETIDMTKDVNLNKTYIIDLQDHTISFNGSNVFKIKADVELKNGTIECGATSGAVDVASNGVLRLNENITINATDTKQAVYNDGGTVYIGDGAELTSTSNQRATVHNKSGRMYITGGTITSTGFYGVYVEAGTLVIGEKDGNIDTSSPIIVGKTYGVIGRVNYSFYDGTIKGLTAAVGIATNSGNTPAVEVDTDESKITSIEDESEKVRGTDSNNYKTLSLASTSKYTVTFDPNGGTVTPSYKIIDKDSAVGELPTPSRGLYTFDGWYDGSTLVDENTVPTGNVTYTAHWHYEASNEITDFNMLNDIMNDYFDKVDEWSVNETTFTTNMDAKFRAYNCSECDGTGTKPYQSCPTPVAGTTLCDQSKGYNTGTGEAVNVYLSDPITKEKGDLVTYTTSTDGFIYNMIPGETYYWEVASDSNIYGYVRANGNRRVINTTVRNVRDLGGLEVDTNNDGTPDGTIKYGRMFRGPKLTAEIDVTNLRNLGITKEIDLRGSTANEPKLSKYVGRQIVNYEIDPENFAANYATLRSAITYTMQDIIDNENIYFHCAIGTDRTGTLAYFLEGLLGVSEEDRLEDYDLSYFYGLMNRHRFYSNQPGSSITHRFVYMHNLYKTNKEIYDFYMYGSTDVDGDKQLIENFRNAVIDKY